jgi:sugar O-acyltransferase (sialic acid O-acetyltransferase NeuD family)
LKLLIYGTGTFADYVAYVLSQHEEYKIQAFCIERSFNQDRRQRQDGIPIVDFESLEEAFPPDDHQLFISIGNNWVRERIFRESKLKGYSLLSYISPRAMVYPNLSYGENVFIDDGTGIQPFSTIGDNTLLLGAKIGHHCRIGSHVLLSACSLAGNVQVGDYSFIAINAAVQQNTAIGKGNIIGMGSIIVSSTADGSVYTEPPAKKRRVSSDDVKRRYL